MLKNVSIVPRLILFGLLLAVGPTVLSAAEPAEPAEPEDSKMDWLKVPHRLLSIGIVETADLLDRCLLSVFCEEEDENGERLHRDTFAVERYRQDLAQKTRIRVSPYVEFVEGGESDFGAKVSAKLDLPHTEDRLQLVIENFNSEEELLPDLDEKTSTKSKTDGMRQVLDEENVHYAGIRLKVVDKKDLRVSFDTGVNLNPGPDPRLGLRGHVTWKKGRWRYRLTESVFYRSDEGFGERTAISVKRHIGQSWTAHETTTLLWSEETDGVDIGQSVHVRKELSDRRAVGIDLALTTDTDDFDEVEGYRANLMWRQKIYRDILFIELEPGARWPEAEDYETSLFFRFKFHILFGACQYN